MVYLLRPLSNSTPHQMPSFHHNLLCGFYIIGGIGIGRGYDPSEIVGDDGVAGKLELQWNQPYPVDFLEDYQLFGFYDIGRVWNSKETISAQKSDSLASTGFGVRADFPQDTKAGIAFAFPMTKDVDTRGDQQPRVYLNLNKSF